MIMLQFYIADLIIQQSHRFYRILFYMFILASSSSCFSFFFSCFHLSYKLNFLTWIYFCLLAVFKTVFFLPCFSSGKKHIQLSDYFDVFCSVPDCLFMYPWAHCNLPFLNFVCFSRVL